MTFRVAFAVHMWGSMFRTSRWKATTSVPPRGGVWADAGAARPRASVSAATAVQTRAGTGPSVHPVTLRALMRPSLRGSGVRDRHARRHALGTLSAPRARGPELREAGGPRWPPPPRGGSGSRGGADPGSRGAW